MKTFYKFIGITSLSLAFAITANASTMSLSPSSKSVNVGDTFTVSVLLDTTSQSIDGVDLQALNYNPYNLQVVDSDTVTSGTQISPGTLMPNTLANSVDTTNGKIVFSQVTSGGTTYKGSGTLATVTFKALVAGNANVTFSFTPGVTTDSNVASQGVDVLSSVTNGQYVIGNVSGTVNGTNIGGTTTDGSVPVNVSGMTEADLRALIAQLLAQVQALQAQLSARLGGGSTAFTRNLTVGSKGEDVRALQVFLNTHGFVIATKGLGSVGSEGTYFGLQTKSALAKYQASVGISPALGFFGPITRQKIGN